MNTLELARKHGMEDGIAKGIEQGIEQGFAKAKKKADAEKLSMALSFKKMGVSIENISKGFGLSIGEVRQL